MERKYKVKVTVEVMGDKSDAVAFKDAIKEALEDALYDDDSGMKDLDFTTQESDEEEDDFPF